VATSLDARIDALYQGPLAGFVPARQALAKTLTGTDARRIKALVKPTVVPWAVNQVFWHARPLYDSVTRTGEQLRAAQIATLRGQRIEVASATARHLRAVEKAVDAAEKSAAAYGMRPSREALARMFEALSLTGRIPEPHGRFTTLLQPPGFEALAGIAIRPGKGSRSASVTDFRKAAGIRRGGASAASASKEGAERERAERRRRDAIRRAEAVLERARRSESRARDEWHRSQQQLEKAAQSLADLRGGRPFSG
jgi:hypothetical protein